MTEEGVIPPSDAERRGRWNFCGRDLPKAEIVFFAQVTLIYVVVIVCLVNLTIGDDKTNLWIALLSGSLGYILPAPNLRASDDGSILPNAAE